MVNIVYNFFFPFYFLFQNFYEKYLKIASILRNSISILKDNIDNLREAEIVVFLTCWHCYEMLIMNPFASKFFKY